MHNWVEYEKKKRFMTSEQKWNIRPPLIDLKWMTIMFDANLIENKKWQRFQAYTKTNRIKHTFYTVKKLC